MWGLIKFSLLIINRLRSSYNGLGVFKFEYACHLEVHSTDWFIWIRNNLRRAYILVLCHISISMWQWTCKHINYVESLNNLVLLPLPRCSISYQFLVHFLQFEKLKVVWCNLEAVCTSVCLWFSPINFWMPEQIFMKLGMYFMASEPISAAYFINTSIQSYVSVCVSILFFKQKLGWVCPSFYW
jgi:hypothetical protein